MYGNHVPARAGTGRGDTPRLLPTRVFFATGHGGGKDRTPKPLYPVPTLVIACLALLCLSSCGRGSSTPPRVAVSGKTVFEGMALEDVPVRVMRLAGGKEEVYGKVKSGYHGSFLVYLPEGDYILTAGTTLKKTTGDLKLEGTLTGLRVSPGDRRIDRLLLELSPVPSPEGG